MFQKYSRLLILVILVVLTSCVSKKKYLEMEAGRLKAEELSRQLDKENNQKAARIKALIADFEAMKNELLESNAIKDQSIDSLSAEVFNLLTNLDQQKESLEKTSFNSDFEQQRLTIALDAKDKTIGSLRTDVETLETEISAKNAAIDQQKFNISRMKDEAEVLEGKIKVGDDKLLGLQNDLQKVKGDTEKLQAEIKEKDAMITRLNNNVKLLKKEIGQ